MSNKLSSAIKGSIGRAARDINKAVKTGSIRALNKATNSAKSKMVKALREETGLPSKRINARVGTTKAHKSRLFGSVNVAVKVGIPLDEFKPKIKKVKVAGIPKQGKRGRPKSRTFLGVTVKIGKQARELVPGGFLTQVGNGKEMILARKKAIGSDGSYSNKRGGTTRRDRFPTVRLRKNVVLDSAKANQDNVKKHMKDTFDKILNHEISFATGKKNLKTE